MPNGNRRHFLEKLGRAALACAGASSFLGISTFLASPTNRKKLNFVFILIDDLGWRDLGCYGSTFYETPNIDHLASEGMTFTDAYAASPVCSPTRASIMTAKYPPRVNITEIVPTHSDGLALSEVTIPERLKEAGYVSASVGKWHLGQKGMYPEDHGFDVNIGGTHVGMPNDFFYPAWKESRHAGGARGGIPVEGKPGEYLPDRLCDEATKFLKENSDKPFFLYLSHYAVHTPIQAKEEIIAKYRQKLKPGGGQNNPIYAAMIQSIDESVGRVMNTLEELGIADNTVVFFTSDNGGLSTADATGSRPTSNTPLREGKGFLYEGGIRVPLIIRWPGMVSAGSVSSVAVSSIDFFPTMVEMAGLVVDPRRPVDGVSLVPMLKQTGTLQRDALYWHYPHRHIKGSEPGSIIRQGDYKLIEFFGDNSRIELYNLKEDLKEANSLAGRMPQKVKELRGLLAQWRDSVGAKMPSLQQTGGTICHARPMTTVRSS